MARSTNRVASRNRRRKVLKRAEGYYGRRKNTIRTAHDAVMKAGQYAYRGRKEKKRDFRSLWIVRISAAVRALGIPYSRFMHALQKQGVAIDRKMLSEIAVNHKDAFAQLVRSIAPPS